MVAYKHGQSVDDSWSHMLQTKAETRCPKVSKCVTHMPLANLEQFS